jgi:hypothetical protein
VAAVVAWCGGYGVWRGGRGATRAYASPSPVSDADIAVLSALLSPTSESVLPVVAWLFSLSSSVASPLYVLKDEIKLSKVMLNRF